MSRQGNSPRPAAYHFMSVAEKRAHALGAAREPPITCPDCSVLTTSRDLLQHLRERCPGRPTPHLGSAWVRLPGAVAMGAPESTITLWARSGRVRTRGGRMDREYLARDLVMAIANRIVDRRRSAKNLAADLAETQSRIDKEGR